MVGRRLFDYDVTCSLVMVLNAMICNFATTQKRADDDRMEESIAVVISTISDVLYGG